MAPFIGLLSLALGLVNCGPNPALAAAGFSFQTSDQGAVRELAGFQSFTSAIANTGSETDTLTVTLVRAMPVDWVTSFCEGSTCYPPFIDQIDVILAPGADTTLDLDITPQLVRASGTASVTVSSGLDPALSQTLTFTVVTPGLDVLLVADDQGAGLESYYGAALSSAGLSHGLWPRDDAGAFSQSDLSGFASVIWFTGAAEVGLESADLSALAYYIQHGGGLLLSGQNVIWAAADPASSAYSPQAVGWFDGVLGVGYLAGDGGDDLVNGLAGDPITDGWGSALAGGGGADDNSSPDSIDVAGATACLTYANGAVAAAHNLYGAGRSLFCAFGCEDIATPTARRDLIAAAIQWFHPASGVPVTPGLRQMAIAPNPFNPVTRISWDLPTATGLRVAIYDVAGRQVTLLRAGVAAAGPGSVVWRGQDSAGQAAPSGIYLCRVEAGATVWTRKMSLVR